MPIPSRPRSPEQLDQQIELVRAPTWILVVALTLILASAAVWGFFGTVLTRVEGRGMLVTARDNNVPVQAESEARVAEVHVAAGQRIKAGALLFRLHDFELEQKYRDAQERLKELEDQARAIAAQAESELAARRKVAQQQRAALDEQVKQLTNQISYYTQRVSDQESLLRSGETIRDRVEAARESLGQARLQLAQVDSQRSQIDVDLIQATATWQQLKLSADLRADDQRATLREAEGALRRATQIFSPIDGIVQEVLTTEGQIVAAASTIARVSTEGEGFEILSFVDPSQGKRIVPGMAAKIVPATVDRDEYGTMSGRVAEVSQRPISVDEVNRLLGNQTLTQFMTAGAPPIFVRLVVDTSPSTQSGFVWRNGSGPPFAVTAGTLAQIGVSVQSQPPITLVLPYLRKLLGI